MKQSCKEALCAREVRANGLCAYHAHRLWCFQNRDKQRASRRNWAKRNADKKKAADKTHYQKNRERILKNVSVWANNNKEKTSEFKRRYYEENKDAVIARTRQWVQNNPEKARANYAAATARYRAAKLRASPPWLDAGLRAQIRKIYSECPEGHHVDHIVPLQGKDVCGLHVPWNLQILDAKENLTKNNKFPFLQKVS